MKTSRPLAPFFLLVVIILISCTDFKSSSELVNTEGNIAERYSQQISSLTVTCMQQDTNGRLWVGTENGLNIYDGVYYHQYFHDEADSTSLPNNKVTALYLDKNGQMWVGTRGGVAVVADYGTFRALPGVKAEVEQIASLKDGPMVLRLSNGVQLFDPNTLQTLPSQHYPQIYKSTYLAPDSLGGFWLCTPTRLTHYDNRGLESQMIERQSKANLVIGTTQGDTMWVCQARQIMALNVNDGEIYYEHEGWMDFLPRLLHIEDDLLYISSYRNGVHCLDTKSFQFLPIRADKKYIAQKMQEMNCILPDGNHGYYAGYKLMGLQHLSVLDGQMHTNPILSRTHNHNIIALDANSSGMVLAGDDSQFYAYDSASGQMIIFNQDSLIADTYFHQQLSEVVADPTSSSKFWIRTLARAVRIDIDKDKVTKDYQYIGNNGLLDLAVDSHGTCYITDKQNRLVVIKSGVESPDVFRVSDADYVQYAMVTPVGDENVLICQSSNQIIEVNTVTGTSRQLPIGSSDSQSNCAPSCILLQDTLLWIGTSSSGLLCYHLDSQRMNHVAVTSNLHIRGLLPDGKGHLFLSTDRGVLTYTPETESLQYLAIKVSTDNVDYILNNEAMCWLGGKLLVASNRGCHAIATRCRADASQIRIFLHDVLVTPESSQSLKAQPNDEGIYVFSYDDNDLSFRFGVLNVSSSQNLVCEFRLEGLGESWRTVESFSDFQSYYPNLPAGEYSFVVRVRDATATTEPLVEARQQVIVKRAPWLSIPAILLYLALAGLAVYAFIQYRLRRRTERMRLLLAEKDKLREQHTNQLNMKFFANISHEFRNPLTIIAGPMTSLLSDAELPSAAKRKLNSMAVSVNRMLKLIDQMLDFNQLEQDALRLKVSQCDVNHELKQWLEPMVETSAVRQIHLEQDLLQDPCIIWLDRDKFDKIMSNLFTNAMKHTPTGGTIRVGLKADDDKEIVCTVYNSGSSIPEDNLSDVFKRYYQVDRKADEQTKSYGWGTGIGLYFVKRLVKLHKGHISVGNVEGGGVEFRFTLPMGDDAYPEDLRHEQTESRSMQIPVTPLSNAQSEQRARKLSDKINEKVARPVILIVDDDIQVANYVKTIFQDNYQVAIRYSAEEALEGLQQIAPDLIISDVIMGKMNGYEMCRHIKQDNDFCHIPVVMLTAKSDLNEQIEGLNCGANAYISKPFQPEYLEAMIETQFRNLTLVRQHLNAATQVESIAEGELTEQDKQFMDQIYKLMKLHLMDFDLNIDTLCHDLLISRSKLNYKMKALTGETPGSFFKKYKLNEAARLLREGKNNVSEVATLTGFATISHFSVSFKKQFGVPPSEFK